MIRNLMQVETLPETMEVYGDVSEQLKKLYKSKLLSLEERYSYHRLHSPQLEDADFVANPIILLMGQYSTGKTTFIRYLLQQDYPGIRIGPEPTTDHFIVVSHAKTEGTIPGQALVYDRSKQFGTLGNFGNAFLQRLICSQIDSPVLKSITLVDTPGILCGQKQTIDRGYDFVGVLEWFAERADRILLFFDGDKVDICDEYRAAIEAMQKYEDKLHIILNKADALDYDHLMRVYGALMWSLGKVLRSPEVVRVFIGSFWDQALRFDTGRRMFEEEELGLFRDFQTLPRNALMRKANDLVKRAKQAKVNAFIMSELHSENRKKFSRKLFEKVYERVHVKYDVPYGDFPDIAKYDELKRHADIHTASLRRYLLDIVDAMLKHEMADIISMICKANGDPDCDKAESFVIKGGPFQDMVIDNNTPFALTKTDSIEARFSEDTWICNRDKARTDMLFNSLGPVNGKICGSIAKLELIKSKLPNSSLSKIWKLADVDHDGALDSDEFALALYLINFKLEGNEIPESLPSYWLPPAKRV